MGNCVRWHSSQMQCLARRSDVECVGIAGDLQVALPGRNSGCKTMRTSLESEGRHSGVTGDSFVQGHFRGEKMRAS